MSDQHRTKQEYIERYVAQYTDGNTEVVAVSKEVIGMYKRRTPNQIKLDFQRGTGKLEHEEATQEAKNAFKHKAYGCASVHKGMQKERHKKVAEQYG